MTPTTSHSTNSDSELSRQLLMKFGPAPTTSTHTSSNSSPTTFSFSAPSPNINASKASEERRNRKQKLMEMKSKRHHQQQQQQPQLQQPFTMETPAPELEATSPEDDENEMKRQKRLLRNRQAAQQSRERKKQRLGELEETINTVLEENSTLKLRIKQLEELLLKSTSSLAANENTVLLPVEDSYSYSTSTPSISSSSDSLERERERGCYSGCSLLTQSSELQLRLAGEELDSFIEEASSPSSASSSQLSPSLEFDESFQIQPQAQHCTTLPQQFDVVQDDALQNDLFGPLGLTQEEDERLLQLQPQPHPQFQQQQQQQQPQQSRRQSQLQPQRRQQQSQQRQDQQRPCRSIQQQVSVNSSGEPAALNRNYSLQLEEFAEISYGLTQQQQQQGNQQEQLEQARREEAAAAAAASTETNHSDSGSQLLATILVMISLCLGSALQSATLSAFVTELFGGRKEAQEARNPSTSGLETSSVVAWPRASSPNSRRKKGRWKVEVTFPSAREPNPGLEAWNSPLSSMILLSPAA